MYPYRFGLSGLIANVVYFVCFSWSVLTKKHEMSSSALINAQAVGKIAPSQLCSLLVDYFIHECHPKSKANDALLAYKEVCISLRFYDIFTIFARFLTLPNDTCACYIGMEHGLLLILVVQ